MAFGPFLRRELITSARRPGTYWGRALSAILMTLIAAASVGGQLWLGRSGLADAWRLGLTTVGIMVAVQLMGTVGSILANVATTIASERDRKSLDTVLATCLSSRQIILGIVAAGLTRSAAELAVVLPFFVLAVSVGGVEPRLVLLAIAGIASTAFATATLAVALSTEGRTARRAAGSASLVALAWILVPVVAILVLPRLWPTGGRLASPVAVLALESSPAGIALNLAGILIRRPLLDAVFRMIELQTAGGIVLIVWAACRLRPASRGLHEAEGRTAFLRSLRTRRRARPACGDDPIFWHEVHTTRGTTRAERIVGWTHMAAFLGVLLYLLSWFAVPAFTEWAEHGYGVVRTSSHRLEVNPFARVLFARLKGLPSSPAPGQARVEFNSLLRQVTALVEFVTLLVCTGEAAECLIWEKERDTWLGLLSTPLTGREILRAKMLGVTWRVRGFLLLLAGLWTVGLLVGAIHPLGFLAAMVGLVVSVWLALATGTTAALGAASRSELGVRALGPIILLIASPAVALLLPAGRMAVLVGAGSMPVLTWMTLLSFEDVDGLVRLGRFHLDNARGLNVGADPAWLLVSFLLGLIAQLLAAFLLTRSMFRRFDVSVGRPSRSGRG